MSNQDLQRVVTGRVRLSYVHLFTPYAKQPGQQAKYSVTILLPKSDVATKQRIDAAINAAIQEGVTSKWNGIRPPQVALPIYDGDGARPSDGMPFGDECKGHWVFTASSPNNAPEVVDVMLNPIINQSEVYSGMYGRVSIRFFPYLNNGKKGVGCGLNNVQKLEDGTPLANGRTSALSDFGGPGGNQTAPAYPTQQPVQPAYQQPAYPQQQVYPQQPSYMPPAQPVAPQVQPMNYGQPGYPTVAPNYPQQPQQIDPITGKPIGQVMGL